MACTTPWLLCCSTGFLGNSSGPGGLFSFVYSAHWDSLDTSTLTPFLLQPVSHVKQMLFHIRPPVDPYGIGLGLVKVLLCFLHNTMTYISFIRLQQICNFPHHGLKQKRQHTLMYPLQEKAPVGAHPGRCLELPPAQRSMATLERVLKYNRKQYFKHT